MRSRNIKPGFFENEKLAELHPLARILFAGLWCYADRDGRFEWRPKRIKALILPYDDCDITCHLMSLHVMTLILQYKHEGELYGFIPNFKKHQNPHPHEARSTLPDPTTCEIVNLPKTELNSCHGMSVKCNADSLIPDSQKIKNSSLHFSIESKEIELACLLRELINQRSDNGKAIPPKTNMQSWAKQIDRMMRLDSRTPREIEDVIRWCQKDEFWQNNILSTGKLRKQFVQLAMKMKQSGGGKTYDTGRF